MSTWLPEPSTSKWELNHDPQLPVTQHGCNIASASGLPVELTRFTRGAEGLGDASLSVFNLGLSWANQDELVTLLLC